MADEFESSTGMVRETLTTAFDVVSTEGTVTGCRKAVDHLSSRCIERASRYEPVYRWQLKRRGVQLDPTRPGSFDGGSVLADSAEYEHAIRLLEESGLPLHDDPPKNWDHLQALDTILSTSDPDATVVDAGGERYSPLVEWLYLYDYRDLHVANIAFDRSFSRGPISYRPIDITDTDFESDTIDYVACLSVLEHDVPVGAFLSEAKRVLVDGGYLLLSTDYWPSGIESEGVSAHGLDWKPFDRRAIQHLVDTARDVGFAVRSEGAVDLDADRRVVTWKGTEFTFVYLEFEA